MPSAANYMCRLKGYDQKVAKTTREGRGGGGKYIFQPTFRARIMDGS